MRTGINPLVEANVPPLPDLVAAVITHLPNRIGYHAGRLAVIQESLRSMRSSVGRALPLYVWDNGSDAEFRSWLVNELRPEFLTLSPNVGKANARTAILRSFPPRTIVCLSDDDIQFMPGWLEPQISLLQGFPNVGAVSGCPIRSQARWGIDSTLDWARSTAGVELETGRFIPDRWEYDYCLSIGRDYLHHLEESALDVDYRIKYRGLSAYAMAHHMQFICYAGALSGLQLWSNRAMRQELPFDLAVDRLGLLRLTTTERLAVHIGNVLNG